MEAPTSEPDEGLDYMDPKLTRVTGWLAIFCAGQIVLGPLISLGSLPEFSESYAKLYPTYPALRNMVGFTECIYLALAIFGIYSGLKVYNKRPNAVVIAKWSLLTQFAGRTVCAIFPFIIGLPPTFTNNIGPAVMSEIIKTGVIVAVWYAYLCHSKKIRAIFGTEVSTRNSVFYMSLVSASLGLLLVMSLVSTRVNQAQTEVSAKSIVIAKDPVYFKSDSGNFSIELPYGSQIPEKKEEILKTEIGPMTNNSYMVELSDSAYTISYYEVPAIVFKVKSTDRLLKDSAEGVAKGSSLHITSYARFEFNGLPATRANLAGVIEGNAVAGRLDLVLSGKRMFALFAVAKSNQEIEGATVRAFFDSFRLNTETK